MLIMSIMGSQKGKRNYSIAFAYPELFVATTEAMKERVSCGPLALQGNFIIL